MNPRTLSSFGRVIVALAVLVSLAVASPMSLAERAVAQGVQIVAILHARNPTRALTKADAKKMFMGQTAFWHGVVPVKLVVRPDGSAASVAFYPFVVGMPPTGFRKHWDELQLSGRGVAPPQAATIQDVIRMVSAVPGGVSFALLSETQAATLTGVKTVNLQ